jgi:hypothetical protein
MLGPPAFSQGGYGSRAAHGYQLLRDLRGFQGHFHNTKKTCTDVDN